MKPVQLTYLRCVLFLTMLTLGITRTSAQVEEDVEAVEVVQVMNDSAMVIMPDTILTQELADSLAARVHKALMPTFRPDPIRAMWLSLVLPGAGQFYNRKYWKLPIVYGGFMGCAYALSWNNQMLRDYSQAYLDIMDSDPNTKSYEKMLPMNYNIKGREAQFMVIFKNKKDYFRKYRDMSIFAFAAVYVLAVVDAYVDAELSCFDISEDLSLHVAPAVITTQPIQKGRNNGLYNERGFGLAFQFNF